MEDNATSGQDGSDAECPTCGEILASEHGMKIHHKMAHDESLVPPDPNDGDWECPWDGCGRAFCSKNAMKTHHAVAHGESIAGVEVTCANCGKKTRVQQLDVDRREHNCCSRECLAEWQSENMSGENHPRYSRVAITCEECGSDFKVRKGGADSIRFCSQDCYGTWCSEGRIGEKHPSWKGRVELVCEQCETVYEVEKWRGGESRFCSIECKAGWQSENIAGKNHPSWNGGKPTHTCIQCGGSFQRYNYQRERDKNLFCSSECRASWQTGENHPRWDGGEASYGRGWTEAKRELVRERDGRECRVCGKSERKHIEEHGQKHTVHHIVKARQLEGTPGDIRNHPFNLVTICRTHHIGGWEQVPPLLQSVAFLPHPPLPTEQTNLSEFSIAD